MTDYIAGHAFDDNRCNRCGRWFSDIGTAQPSDVGYSGWCCNPLERLDSGQLNDIKTKAEKVRAAIAAATGW